MLEVAGLWKSEHVHTPSLDSLKCMKLTVRSWDLTIKMAQNLGMMLEMWPVMLRRYFMWSPIIPSYFNGIEF